MLNKENTGILIQARTGSTRLPEKMIKPFYNGKSILELLLERISRKLPINIPIVVATTNSSGDDVIQDLALKIGVQVFRGSQHDVLKRFIDAADKHKFSKIIRICADNPFLDTEALNQLINDFSISEADYFSYCTHEGIPTIKTHFGFWTEGAKIRALRKIASITSEKVYREHVTNYLYSPNSGFDIKLQQIDSKFDTTKIRLTIDTIADFQVAQEIYSFLMDKYHDIPNSMIIIDEVNKNKSWLVQMGQEIINNFK